MKSNEYYNRLSFRSPFRKTNVVNAVKSVNTDIKIEPIKAPEIQPKMNNRISCRSPLNTQNRKVKKTYEDPIYNIVTKTASGEPVKVPTEKSTFIKFKEKSSPLAMPIKQVVQKELLPMKKCKFEEALIIYENNQSYYLDKIMYEKDEEIVMKIIKEIDILEKWFCNINEPKPKSSHDVKDWRLRNQFKIDHSYSKYFDIDLLYYTDYK